MENIISLVLAFVKLLKQANLITFRTEILSLANGSLVKLTNEEEKVFDQIHAYENMFFDMAEQGVIEFCCAEIAENCIFSDFSGSYYKEVVLGIQINEERQEIAFKVPAQELKTLL